MQVASDLHIEYKREVAPDILTLLTPSAPVLLLVGDIGSLYKIDQLGDFLTQASKHWKHVLYVPGNHEYYTMKGYQYLTMRDLKVRLHSLTRRIHNLSIIDNSSVEMDIGGKTTMIVGSTMWSTLNGPLPKYIVRINGMSTNIYRELHTESVEYIRMMTRWCERENIHLIVATHYPPTDKILSTKLGKSKVPAKFKSLYASNLESIVTSAVHVWVSGHIHKNYDYVTQGGTRMVGNMKGKPRDKITDFSGNMVVG